MEPKIPIDFDVQDSFVESLENGASELWDEFFKGLDVIKDELSLLRDFPDDEMEMFKTEGVGLSYTLEHNAWGYKISFDVNTETEGQNLDEWESVTLNLRVIKLDGYDYYSKNGRFRNLPNISKWMTLAFHQRNLRNKHNLEDLFGGQDIRIISSPDN